MTLADDLVRRLAEVLPPGLVIAAVGGSVAVWSHDRGELHTFVDVGAIVEGGLDPDEQVASASLAVLSTVQDVVAEATAEPWPGHGAYMPLPETRVEGGELRLWYGDEHDPALALPPVSLVD